MSRDVRLFQVCLAEDSIAFEPVSFCDMTEVPANSPIDDFYDYLHEVLPLGQEEALAQNNVLGRMLLLGLVSGVELYFRTLLAAALEICPLSRTHAAKQTLSIASIDYYGLAGIGFGLLENISFATEGEIVKHTQRLLNIAIPKNSSVASAIERFEKLCHLRHAAVHSRGQLSSGNLSALGIENKGSRKALALRLPQMHIAASICQAAVRAYNRYVFRAVIERWMAAGLLAGDWSRDKDLVSRLFWIFYSRKDRLLQPNPYAAYQSLRHSIIQRVGRN